MRTGFVVVAALALAVVCASEATIYEFLKGDWEVFVYKTQFQAPGLPEDVESTHYAFNPRNGTTSVLDAVALTEEGKTFYKVLLSGPFKGEFLAVNAADTTVDDEVNVNHIKQGEKEAVGDDMGLKAEEPTVVEKKEVEPEDVDEEGLLSMFAFSFMNLTEGHYVSQGSYGENGAYQAIISTGAKPSFTMTLYKVVDGKTTEYVTVLAKKVMPKAQPSFLSKFGLPLMMGAMMLMNMAKGPGAAAAAAGGGAAPAAAAADAAAAAPAPAGQN